MRAQAMTTVRVEKGDRFQLVTDVTGSRLISFEAELFIRGDLDALEDLLTGALAAVIAARRAAEAAAA
jgi:hypothetical protein